MDVMVCVLIFGFSLQYWGIYMLAMELRGIRKAIEESRGGV